MVNIELLKSRGIDAEKLRELFNDYQNLNADRWRGDKAKSQKEKLDNFHNRMRMRIQQGRESNIAQHKTYYALDLAWDAPFKQLSPTLLQTLLDKDPDDSTVNSSLNAWGFNLNEVLVESEDPKTKKKIKRVNIPAFFAIFVPIVKAYVTMRQAKIMNDRWLVPFLKYEPIIDNTLGRLRGYVFTERAETMTQQYGLFNCVKQAVFQMLHYSICLMFPVEEWHQELQECGPGEEGLKDPDNDKTVRIVREGIRYHMPHPSRMFFDQAHRPSTINTDTGCEYAGYWRVLKYKDIRNNAKFFNTDKVSIGQTDWWNEVGTVTFFNTVYNGCTIKGPPVASPVPKDRETQIAENVYTAAMDDQPVLFTEYFEKLIPSECGFGDYDYPVWFRFVVAQFDTVLYAAPVPYTPPIYFGYDADENRSQNASMSLECLPFQDHFSHLMTQFILSTKQNLANAVFVDTDVVGKDWIDIIRNWGEKIWRTINFVPFSGRRATKSQHGVPQAFFAHKFALHDTEALIRAMNIVLDTMERVLVMSSQEVAQSASHEQTREEVRLIASNTSTRLTHTARAVDFAMEAMKRQIYEATMTYGQDEFWSQIPLDHLLTPAEMEKMGFTVQTHLVGPRDKKVTVKVKKTAIMYESFTSRRDGSDRINNAEGGIAMLNFLMQVVASPMYQIVGPDQMLQLINLSAHLVGFPREFKLDKVHENTSPEQQQEQMKGMITEIEKAILPDIQKGLIPLMQQQKELSDEVNGLSAAVNKIMQMAAAAPQLPPANDSMPINPAQPSQTLAASPMA